MRSTLRLLGGPVTALVLAGAPAATAPAAAVPAPVAPTPSATAAGPDRVAAAAARVLVLADAASRHAALATAAASRLQAEGLRTASAELEQARADDAVAEARAARVARARAAVTGRSRLELVLTVITATSPDEALWRLSTSAQLNGTLLRRAGADLAGARERATTTAEQLERSRARGAELARALATARAESDAAQVALGQARAALAAASAQERARRELQLAAQRLADATAAADGARDRTLGPVTAAGIPAAYLQLYRAAAATCPGMAWSLLAAVGQVESGHGLNPGPSSAGAVGPMQFMPATFAEYAVDGDHDGRLDPWAPADAIFTAARYLCRSGADGTADGVRRALFAYNHAQWYVDLVLRTEVAILSAGRPG